MCELKILRYLYQISWINLFLASFIFVFYLGFLSHAQTNHGIGRERRGHLYSSVTLPLVLEHSDICKFVTEITTVYF